jgi:hypothetical protein
MPSRIHGRAYFMQSDSALALNHLAWCSEPKWHVDALRPPISSACMVEAIASVRGKQSALAFMRLALGSAWRYFVHFLRNYARLNIGGARLAMGLIVILSSMPVLSRPIGHETPGSTVVHLFTKIRHTVLRIVGSEKLHDSQFY